jgi:hypothetical protein
MTGCILADSPKLKRKLRKQKGWTYKTNHNISMRNIQTPKETTGKCRYVSLSDTTDKTEEMRFS